jgi:hypothetical protein
MTNLKVVRSETGHIAFVPIPESLSYAGVHTRYDAALGRRHGTVIGSTSSSAIAMPHCNAHLFCICNLPEKPHEHAD